MSKAQYTRYCVAFLDILGFKNLVGTEDTSTIHSIFGNIRRAKKLIQGLSEKILGGLKWARRLRSTFSLIVL